MEQQLVAWQSFWQGLQALVWGGFSWVRRVARTNRSSASCSPVDKIKFSATPTRVIIGRTLEIATHDELDQRKEDARRGA
jgi:hypothetical protein